MWCLRLVPLALIAACHGPASSALPRGPLASPMASWIPADVVLAVVATPGAPLDAVDQVAAAIGWTTVDELLPDGARMRMVLEAEVNALCRDVPPDAPLPVGKVRSTAGALLIDVGDEIVVMRDAVACTVYGGAASRRDHQALRLAVLTDEERLLQLPAARAALAALPDSPLLIWGGGDLIAGISIERMDRDAALWLGAVGDVAVAIGVDDAERRVWIAMARSVAIDAMARTEVTRVPVGPRARPPAAASLAGLPVPVRDENVDVPESAEYRQAVGRLGAVLSEAVEVRTAIAEVEARAVEAYATGWGDAEMAHQVRDGVALRTLRWTPPVWPVQATRAQATEAYQQVIRADPSAQSRYDVLVADAQVLVDELVKIRARDVAAWDKSHR